jgi:phosphotriesterase-related protein
MKQEDLVGKAQTVLGVIDPDSIGITLAHEHILIDFLVFFEEPTTATDRKMAHEPIKMENMWWIRPNMFTCLDNIRLIDEDLAIKETTRFKRAGGSTIVEMTNIGINRDPLGLARVARATGLNIIMGSGFYVGVSQNEEALKMNEEELADKIVEDVLVGIDGTDIRSGMIGEIGSMVPIDEFEQKSLRATAIAQQRTGAPVNIHSSHGDNLVLDDIEILKDAGADLTRVVMSHIDAWYIDYEDVIQKILDQGCYVEYDTFGYEGAFPPYQNRHYSLPTDEYRIKSIMKLIEKGYIEQIVIASDHCTKHAMVSYGGWGYDHIVRNIVPLMKINGMTDEQIQTLIVDNPKRLLTFASVK